MSFEATRKKLKALSYSTAFRWMVERTELKRQPLDPGFLGAHGPGRQEYRRAGGELALRNPADILLRHPAEIWRCDVPGRGRVTANQFFEQLEARARAGETAKLLRMFGLSPGGTR